ncbi:MULTISPECIES: P-loop NTPase [unclassified Methylophaga]|jgi:protein-tyrosine kinase|uniref:P-loop NTPase n=1 Tax=unclassified Methylophaga TaxID=2629249 RepID=UPI000C68F880|nr:MULTISPECIES: P-loop NTPase [unclassified Methylophaga]MAL48895.1 exopolysaccharide biosynthesis protein [Methylophaga sp.]MBP40696.1 exopolysaccharide biosynthesis protein [Aequorivita sp.]HCC82664.1 exopolysaccharide biosynthesis protein [Methylophaga sp.]|tara:strand:- start:27437 stop:28273 length:837 start_codon:yes stop_codon:yes gene_type:complete
MDRIQKALEKAKQRHAQKPEPIRVEPTKAENSVSQAEDPLAAPIESISYSQTKVVNVPNHQLERKRIIAGFYNNPQSAVFRMLRTQVLKKMRSNRWQTLAVTSPTAGEGKSVVAANLAMAIAMELNQTVLLVDMDLRNPSISNYFGLNAQVGLKDYLSGDLKLSEVLINPGIKRLVILPGVGRAEDSAELLSSPKMASLVADIKSQYDSRVIIFDVPPVLQTDDVSLAASYFDSTLLVLEDGKNTESNITKSLQMLEGSPLLGTVVNKSASPPEHQNY